MCAQGQRLTVPAMTTTTDTHLPQLSARTTWAAGDWDSFSERLISVGALVLERSAIGPAVKLLDVATGSGGNTAIPAAQRGASVVGLDITPELLVKARRRAAEFGVDI
jgi:2-polyprenyl-3-methyl-5-hydroxy-6-metoxy-1,4-benzoquinol methylase